MFVYLQIIHEIVLNDLKKLFDYRLKQSHYRPEHVSLYLRDQGLLHL